MDTIAHTLLGVAMGRAGLARRCGRGTTWILVLGSNLPDLDAPLGAALGPLGFLERRMWTHSVAGVAVLCAAAAPVLARFFPAVRPRTVFLLLLLACAGHVFFDLINSFGVVLLHPFSLRRFELGWAFVVDPWIWGALALPVLLLPVLRAPRARERAFRWGLAALAVYLAACAGMRWGAATLVQRVDPRAAQAPGEVRLFPEPGGPHRFRAVVPEEGAWRVWLVHVLRGRAGLLETVDRGDDDPRVRAVQATPDGRRLSWMFSAPVWRVLSGGHAVEVRDLRFATATLDRPDPFRRVLPVPLDGR